MKVYFKKITVLILVFAIMFSTIPTSAFTVLGYEFDEAEHALSTDETMEAIEEEKPSDVEENKSIGEEKSEAPDIEEFELVETEEIKLSNEKDDSISNSDNSNIEEDDEKFLEDEMKIKVYALSDEEVESNTESDFTYYFESDKNDRKSCSHSQINSIIENATEKMYIEMNNDVALSETILFSGKNCSLDLNNHILTTKNGGYRVINVEKSADVTIKKWNYYRC